MTEAWGIAANYNRSDSSMAGPGPNKRGALCWLCWWQSGQPKDRNMMLCRSRSGRWIRRWMQVDRMSDWRVRMLPPGLASTDKVPTYYPTKAEAEAALRKVMP